MSGIDQIKIKLFLMAVIVALLAADYSAAAETGQVDTLPVGKILITATSATASNTFTIEGYADGQEYHGFYVWQGAEAGSLEPPEHNLKDR